MKTCDFVMTTRMYLRILMLTILPVISCTFLHAQLSGTKTIGAGGDYASFTAAVAALTSQGVSGAVTFNVKSGTYNEQIEIGSIAGASSGNTITFQSQSGNPADVTLTFTPNDTNNYVVRLVQAAHVTFQNMTLDASSGILYGIVVKLDGESNNNSFLKNIIKGVSTTTNSADLILFYADDDSSSGTTIAGNTFSDGSLGVALVGTNPDFFSTGTQVTDNVFTNQASKGISLFYHNGAHINDNTISSTSVNVTVGIEATRCDSGLQVLRNKVTIPNSGYGINLYSCNGGAGISGIVANNFITSLHGNGTGLWVSNCTYQDIYYNSINITNESFEGQALLMDGTAANVNIVNNIFANEGTGYCYSMYSPASVEVARSDYNNFYTTGTRVAFWEGLDVVDMAALRTASGREAHSISVNPSFYSSTNLHVYVPDLDSTGTPLAAIATDIDGEPRDPNRPDIGADEFVIAHLSLNQGWNMASVPVIAADYQATSLFPGVTASVFASQSGSYVAKTTLANRPGYWVKYGGASVVTITGGPIRTDTFDVALGWNLIGSISYPIPVSSVTSNPGGLVTSPFYQYNLAYQAADTIKPGKAYWVKLSSPGSLILSGSGNVPFVNRIRILPDNEMPPPSPHGETTEAEPHVPTEFRLEQNFPNPFNPSTVILYSLPVSTHVTLKLFNAFGQLVETLVDGSQEAGYKSVPWDAGGLASGVYLCRLQAGEFQASQKLLFMK